MPDKSNIVSLFGEDKKPSLEYMTLYDMLRDTLARVVFLEQSMRKIIRAYKNSKGSDR